MAVALRFSFNTAGQITLALALVLVVVFAIMGYRSWRSSRVSPEERERQRRAALVTRGKMGDATLMEVREEHIFYGYIVRGVEYTASQNVSSLKEFVPADLASLAAVSVRYDPRNPANSIVLSEQWTGLHVFEPKKRR